MGFAQAMENLTEGIRSATATRSASLSNLRQDVEQYSQELKRQMNNIHNENRNNARELRGKLTALREQLGSEEKGRQNTAGQETEQRRVVQSELRSNTHSLLSRARLERQGTTKALQEKISSEMNDRHNAVNNIRGAAKSMLGEITADLRGAHEVWGRSKKKQQYLRGRR